MSEECDRARGYRIYRRCDGRVRVNPQLSSVRQFPFFVEIIRHQDFALDLPVYGLAQLQNRIVSEAREKRRVRGCHLVAVEGMPAIQDDVAAGIERIGINHRYGMTG